MDGINDYKYMGPYNRLKLGFYYMQSVMTRRPRGVCVTMNIYKKGYQLILLLLLDYVACFRCLKTQAVILS